MADKPGQIHDTHQAGLKADVPSSHAREEAQHEAMRLHAAKSSHVQKSDVSSHLGHLELVDHKHDDKTVTHLNEQKTPKVEEPKPNLVSLPYVQDKVSAPVLKDSKGLVTSTADQILVNEHNSYNCHFYTATTMLGHEPKGGFFPKDAFNLKFDFAERRGYQQSDMSISSTFSDHKKKLQPGDILTVTKPNHSDGYAVTHSAVVIKGGDEPIIRQKFSPTQPVVDLTAKQFKQAYLDGSDMEIYVWRK